MMNAANLKAVVRGIYDLQKLRIQTGNRIVGNWKVKVLGQRPGMKESELDAEAKKILREIRAAYKKITDGAKKTRRRGFKGEGVIGGYTEFCLVDHYVKLEAEEKREFRHLAMLLEEHPIWTGFLLGVKGVGPAMAGVIVAEIDIHRAKYPSSLWAYAGLDVAADGRGRSKRAEHLVDRAYTDKDGKPATRKSITFNPFLKTKLLGVLAASFLRCKGSPYADVYREHKHGLEGHARYGVQNDKKKDENGRALTSKGRRHNMAMRYMIKRFLVNLYRAWRPLEGLPVAEEYAVAKLGREHAQAPAAGG